MRSPPGSRASDRHELALERENVCHHLGRREDRPVRTGKHDGSIVGPLLRPAEERYKALRLGQRDLTDDQIVDLMVTFPELIQRPIVEKGARAVLARPAERVREIL